VPCYNERTSEAVASRRRGSRLRSGLLRPSRCQTAGWGYLPPPDYGEGDRIVSNCNPTHPDRKSTAENFAHHHRLSPAEKVRRVAALRRLLHARTLRARIEAGQRGDLP